LTSYKALSSAEFLENSSSIRICQDMAQNISFTFCSWQEKVKVSLS